MQISPEVMHEGVATIYEQQKAIGYDSAFIEGEADCMRYMKGLFDDWQAQDITSVLHEKRGGYANNMASLRGLAGKALDAGVRILEGVTVTGFEFGHNSRAVSAVLTDQGAIECDYVVIGAGPWVTRLLGHARPAEDGHRSRAATARCTTTFRCGASGSWRRACSASTRASCTPTTAGCRP